MELKICEMCVRRFLSPWILCGRLRSVHAPDLEYPQIRWLKDDWLSIVCSKAFNKTRLIHVALENQDSS